MIKIYDIEDFRGCTHAKCTNDHDHSTVTKKGQKYEIEKIEDGKMWLKVDGLFSKRVYTTSFKDFKPVRPIKRRKGVIEVGDTVERIQGQHHNMIIGNISIVTKVESKWCISLKGFGDNHDPTSFRLIKKGNNAKTKTVIGADCAGNDMADAMAFVVQTNQRGEDKMEDVKISGLIAENFIDKKQLDTALAVDRIFGPELRAVDFVNMTGAQKKAIEKDALAKVAEFDAVKE